MAMTTPIHGHAHSSMDSSVLLEMSRSALEMASRAREDVKEMADKAREDVKEMAGRAREDVKEMADRAREDGKEMAERAREDVKEIAKMVVAESERQTKATDAAKTVALKIGEVTVLPKTVPGCMVRLGMLVLILRWRPLLRLLGKLVRMAAK
eukprot:SAG11_NODE_6239_length_1355_cov_2.410828_2_plen_153_part_00